ncbi:hypothetical protein ELY33_17080 [Vreelandella andesensis]|uniref:Uncharacterized protein n=1 Tax=Vreelandella andesensis TaxID=447567 RepID=A0A433KF95_9GAMM|nr:hypothetical protein [Halomonas andesensis]RUR26821.1 hypothetical protein ELY33_17080 [Halomonas andesensis]
MSKASRARRFFDYEPWAEWEDEFVTEVYPLASWKIAEIAKKLDRTVDAVVSRAHVLSVKRPPHQLDYDAIWQLWQKGYNYSRIANRLGYLAPSVSYAVKAMQRGRV